MLGSCGAIVVYHAAFERGVLNGLAETFPDLAHSLPAALDRVVDLEPVVRDHYYHRDMRGSYSVKKVLPTHVPQLAYDTLGEVRSGDGARAAYAEAIRPATTPARRAEIERALLAYCRRDTEAMVAVARGVAT